MSLVGALMVVLMSITLADNGPDRPTIPKRPLTTPVTSHVRIEDGVPRLVLNQSELVPFTGKQLYPSYSLYNGRESATWKALLDEAADHGYLYVSPWLAWFLMDPHKDGPPENAADWIDWAPLDAFMDYAAAKGLYVIPYFWTAYPPAWWYQRFGPEYVQTSDVGNPAMLDAAGMASFNAPPHVKCTGQVIAAMVARYARHPALLGWGLGFGSSNENNYPGGGLYEAGGWFDYSPFIRSEFHAWLRRQYGDADALRTAWGDKSLAFDTVEPPKPLANSGTGVAAVNDAGDVRRAFYDWQCFRIEQKKLARDTFGQLFKQLDPDRILVTMPGIWPFWGGWADPGGSSWPAAGSFDYDNVIRAPYVDGLVLQPPINEFAWSGGRWASLQVFAKYAHSHGKLFAPIYEDYGVNDRLSVLDTFLYTAVSLGSGVGWTEGTDGDGQTLWSDVERAHAAHGWYLTQRAPKVLPRRERFAFIDSPLLASLDYAGKGPDWTGYRAVDLAGMPEMMTDAGLEYDVLMPSDVQADAPRLERYKAVGLVNTFRMTPDFVDALATYRAKGGGLFIAGRSAAFDQYGRSRPEFLQQLLGLSRPPKEYALDAPASWHFVERIESGLLTSLVGAPGHQDAVYTIPVFDYEAEGYSVLATLDRHPDVAVVGCKDNVVFWFSKLGHQFGPFTLDPEGLDFVMQFMRNLYGHFGVGYDKSNAVFLQSIGGNYKCLLTNNSNGYHDRIGFDVASFTDDLTGSFLVFNCTDMKPLALDRPDPDGRVWANVDLEPNRLILIHIAQVTAEPAFVAGEWAVMDDAEWTSDKRRLRVKLDAALDTQPRVAFHLGSAKLKSITCDGAKVLQREIDPVLGIVQIVLKPERPHLILDLRVGRAAS